ncbi:hypothetical protein [Gemmata palustris]|uniref:hypothetical protein n=1 Tax=Gemmata palustris TaxID=2822762 RepID=UPI001FE5CEB9|nr:hypothetical protein [Gemmata palustris]
MTEAEWLACEAPTSMLRAIGEGEKVLSAADTRRAQLFLCACCRRVEVMLPNFWNRAEPDTVEQSADGLASDQEYQESAHRIRDSVSVVHRRFIDEGRPIHCETGQTGAELPVLRGLREALVEARLFHVSGRDTTTGTALALQTATNESEFREKVFGTFRAEQSAQVALLRDIFGNPFRPVAFSPSWRTSTTVALASQMYESRDFSAMPILADALQDAGCNSAEVLDHCRGPGPHVRGCWVVDLVLDKE